MSQFISRDAIAGAVLIGIGFFFAGYAATQLPLGTFARMGSGMFPFLTGVAITLLGGTLLTQTLMRARNGIQIEAGRQPEKPQWFALLIVLASIAVFAETIRRFGMITAIFGLVLVASRASDKLTWPVSLVLAATLSLLAWLIFVIGLGLPIPVLRWPF